MKNLEKKVYGIYCLNHGGLDIYPSWANGAYIRGELS